MTPTALLTADVLIAYGAYFVGTASPGPSNLAIMSLAMRSGRQAALTFALGVVSGSYFWALLAWLGLSAVLATYSQCLVAIKIAGGLYLLWLGFKSARSAFRSEPLPSGTQRGSEPLKRLYLRGLLLHLTNPKAILVWMSIVSLSVSPTGGASHMTTVVLGCMGIGVSVFSSYAVLFSTESARRVYLSIRRWLDGSLAIMFGMAGLKMLTSKS